MTEIILDKRFDRHPASTEIFLKVKKALREFPEIKKLTLTACKSVRTGSICRPMQDNTISFNTRFLPTTQTIYHELFKLMRKK